MCFCLSLPHKGPDIAVVSDQIVKIDTTVLNERKRRVEDAQGVQHFDDLRNYAYEGAGSTAGSLSSVLESGTKLK